MKSCPWRGRRSRPAAAVTKTARTAFADLIAAERTLRDAEAESLSHRADYEAAVAELAAVVGVDFHSLPSSK